MKRLIDAGQLFQVLGRVENVEQECVASAAILAENRLHFQRKHTNISSKQFQRRSVFV